MWARLISLVPGLGVGALLAHGGGFDKGVCVAAAMAVLPGGRAPARERAAEASRGERVSGGGSW